MRTIDFKSLPDDMQELIGCIFEDAERAVPEQLPIRSVPLQCLPDVELSDGIRDARGIPHAIGFMRASYIPVLVVNGNVWMDATGFGPKGNWSLHV